MLDLQIPIFSSVAGDSNDGIVVGKISQSSMVAVLSGSALVSIAQVLRKDVTSTGVLWTDVTTAATDAVTGDFSPFGTTTTMSNGDAFYVRTTNDVDTHAIYAQISTAGAGSWGMTVKEWNELTSTWEIVTGLVDTSNAFRNATGVYKISYTSGAEGRIRLDDTSPIYKWHKIELINFVSATTAPVLSRIWMADTAIKLTNVTASYTSSPADFSSLPSEELPVIGNYNLIVHPGIPIGEEVTITTPRSANYSCIWEYLATDGTYKSITITSDPSNNYTAIAGTYKIRWTPASDWTSKTVTDSNNSSYTGWVLRCRITAITTEGPVTPPHIQAKSRSLGAGLAEGVYHYVAKTYSGISLFEAGVPSASTVSINILNSDTGATQTVTIPINTSSSVNLASGRIDFTTNLSIGVGQSLLMMHSGGGTLQDVKMKMQEIT